MLINQLEKSSASAVSAAFLNLLEAMNKYSDDISLECAEASCERKLDRVTQLVEKNKRVVGLIKEVEANSIKWSRFEAGHLKSKGTRDRNINNTPRSRKLAMTIKVDGKYIEAANACDMFVAAIKQVGTDRVSSLGLKFMGAELVSKTKAGSHINHKMIDQWCIVTHFSNIQKKQILEKIGQSLNVPITVRLENHAI
ncbi:MAG: hypothetical protein WCL27_16465 [Betaproteobacteria bacterium]